MGCLRRVGCLLLIIAIAAVAWVARDQLADWFPQLRSWIPGLSRRAAGDGSAGDVVWRAITPGGASHAEQLLVGLEKRSAATYTNVLPSDFAAFFVKDVTGYVPPAKDSAQAAIVNRRLALRTSLDIDALGGRAAFGPVGKLLGEREPLTIAGTFDVVRPGVAEFRVQELTVHGLPVPSPLIPDLVRKVENGPHPAGLAPEALLLNVPPYVADIRVVGDRIAVYRTPQ